MRSTIRIKMSRLLLLTMLLIALFPATNWATELNPTQYILKGQTAPFTGFVIEEQRLKMCVIAVQDSQYYKGLTELQKQYYEQRLADQAEIGRLQLELKTKESASVEKGLKAEVAKKSVWYRQWYVTVPATALVFILSGGLIP